MSKPVALTFSLYALWAGVMAAVACYGKYMGIGEYAISAHLWLSLTGLPSSLLSWLLPHASLVAVFVAAVAGLSQWTLLVWLNSRNESK